MSVVFSDQPNSQIPVNSRRKIPPGPRGKPIIGNLREFRSDILGLLETSARAYGEIVHFRVGPREIFLLNDSYYIQHVLQTNSRNYRPGRSKIPLTKKAIRRLDKMIQERRHQRDEVMWVFWTGHETTANVLAWTWYLLSENPAATHQLYAELDSVLHGRLPTIDDVLPYTQAVLKESMRLYPPVWLMSRQAIGDDEIGGYPIPTGSTVIVSPYIMHRNPTYWENPEQFDPTRFLGETSQWRPHFSYFPFGGGQGIGMDFVMIEAQLGLATVAQSYRLAMKK